MTEGTRGPTHGGDADLRLLASRIWAGRSWILASGIALAAVFAAAAFTMTPVYRASTLLIAASTDQAAAAGGLGAALGSLGRLAPLAGIALGAPATVTDEALAVLRSRQFTESFINDRNLMPELFADKWDKKAGRWAVGPDKQPTSAQAYNYFDKVVRGVSQDKKTGLVTVQVEWKDRSIAAAWTNDLVRRLNEEMRSRAISKASAALTFLKAELDATSTLETREAINRLIEAQINQRMISNVTAEYSFRVVDPAMAPDKGDTVRPKKALLVIFGLFLGLAAGVLAVILFRSVAAT